MPSTETHDATVDVLISNLERAGVRLRLEGNDLRVSAPPGALSETHRSALKAHKPELVRLLQARTQPVEATLQPDPDNRFAPFALTDIQRSYWLGRNEHLEMGSVATHLYLEFDCDRLDVKRLEEALQVVIARHAMLRAIVRRDGTQTVLEDPPPYRIAVRDLRRAPAPSIDAAQGELRDELSHQVLIPDRWPLFDVRALQLPNDRVTLHVSLDLLILDAFSMFILFKEWHQSYQGIPLPAPPGVEFRDYVMTLEQQRTGATYETHRRYWAERVPELPAAPQQPLRADASLRRAARFTRREMRMGTAAWSGLKLAARKHGLTPSGLVMAVYCEVLARWSAVPHFTLNVTVADRRPLHTDVERVIGDFTSLTLVEVDGRDSGRTFVEFASALQRRFLSDLQHNAYSGVRVLQDWTRHHGYGVGATMPVVFSSGLIRTSDEDPGHLEVFGTKSFSVSQTSQVWLDHHVMELQGELVLIWDSAAEIFEPGVVDAMFAAYTDALVKLASPESTFAERSVIELPSAMATQRQVDNATAIDLGPVPLHLGFVRHAERQPSSLALACSTRELSYGELLDESCAVAHTLLASGVHPGDHVAVVMSKGWEQVVAVLGTLLASAVYVPIDAGLPPRRRQELVQSCSARAVLVQGQSGLDALGDERPLHEVVPGGRAALGPDLLTSLQRPLSERAYVIFTSGTTGTPKGVLISHGSAANTIAAINRKLNVTAGDRVLAVSSLSFDLSVYDIFGVLAAGGAIVLPDASAEHDAMHWHALMEKYDVSLWNSAPQLMQMLVAVTPRSRAPLRNVMLSGDFIPLDLPDRIREVFPAAALTSLGGATEAAIWSNYFDIANIDPAWTSIPYGKPLANQQMWVLDSAMRPCPDFVRGGIYIGGEGLADGYWQDTEKTQQKFVINPEGKQRLYDTGDCGLYRRDGNIVILGRADNQIKIRGHRVEPGEIEAVLCQRQDIEQAVVLLTPDLGAGRRLVAWLKLASERDLAVAPEPSDVLAHVAQHLPSYMQPQHLVFVDALPLTSNGKVDQRALVESFSAAFVAPTRVQPRSDIEARILGSWSRVIPGVEIGVTDNFFELGGDSVMAAELAGALNEELPEFVLEMHELFENLTVEALATLYEQRGAQTQAPRPFTPWQDAALADVEQQKALVPTFSALPSARSSCAVLVTGATGFLGSHVLAALLRQTSHVIECLVRDESPALALELLTVALGRAGFQLDPNMADRIVPIVGDLCSPRFGLSDAQWRRLGESVHAVYHFAGSTAVLQDYATLREPNITPLPELLRLLGTGPAKALYLASPMTVNHRQAGDHITVLPEEVVYQEPDGLLSAYAATKWVVEKTVSLAIEQGLQAIIYRTSHALPSSATALGKPGDTFITALRTAVAAAAVPAAASLKGDIAQVPGLPVDILAQVLVAHSLAPLSRGVVHVENPNPPSLASAIAAMASGLESEQPLLELSAADWKRRCLDIAPLLAPEERALASVLFSERQGGAAVDHMFAVNKVRVDNLRASVAFAHVPELLPRSYWVRLTHAATQSTSED